MNYQKTNLLIQVIYLIPILVYALAVAFCFYRDDRIQRQLRPPLGDRGRYRPHGLSVSMILPPMLLLGVLLSLIRGSATFTRKVLSPVWLDLFLHISLCYSLIAPVQPILRRHFSARACAALWIMPGMTFLFRAVPSIIPTLVTIRIPYMVTKVLPIIWLTGFIGIVCWKVIDHLLFRKKIMWTAAPIKYGPIHTQWVNAQKDVGLSKPTYPLYVSNDVSTPFSIGFFRKTIRVILPKKDYAPEELELIFHHELVHIGRKDSGIKFTMLFFAAILWFNPLMWYALRSSNDDLELSCDETVLLNQPDSVRQKYGRLLLSTAGESRGFTTNLSASARSMAYRLRNSLNSRKRMLGSFLIAGLFLLFSATHGAVSFAAESGSLTDMIVDVSGTTVSNLRIFNVTIYYEDGTETKYHCTDVQAFLEILDEITVYRIPGKAVTESQIKIRQMIIQVSANRSTFTVALYGKDALIHIGMGRQFNIFEYIMEEEIPWDLIIGYLTPAK